MSDEFKPENEGSRRAARRHGEKVQGQVRSGRADDAAERDRKRRIADEDPEGLPDDDDERVVIRGID